MPLSSKEGAAASSPAFNLSTRAEFGVSAGECARGLSQPGCLKMAHWADCRTVTTKKLREEV